jgi:hypothetical protein
MREDGAPLIHEPLCAVPGCPNSSRQPFKSRQARYSLDSFQSITCRPHLAR